MEQSRKGRGIGETTIRRNLGDAVAGVSHFPCRIRKADPIHIVREIQAGLFPEETRQSGCGSKHILRQLGKRDGLTVVPMYICNDLLQFAVLCHMPAVRRIF